MKLSIKLARAMAWVSFIFIATTGVTAEAGKAYDLPLRFIARAEVNRLRYDYYSVRECLDVYNDDNLRPLVITGVTVDSWHGHQISNLGENWFANRAPLTVEPGKTLRVVEHKHTVLGRRKRDWWVRWIRFNISTSRGQFVSNFVATPFKRPGKILSEHVEPQIDTLAEPGALSPAQKRFGGDW
ncbi:MAG: hypothetical protein CVV42_10725 [Candidatus Riflebacteria bacterium HGW-Riflebacteria-2]|jgi:hypothetical protein|nr:MAG: hypothetical protein CVV42_10725 [Candidatus Riflebacteria bacterium HGW-Riflebacteria-2]